MDNIINLLKKYIFISLIFLISLFVGYFTFKFSSRNILSVFLLVIMAGIIPIIVLLLKPYIGLIILIPASLIIPFSLGTGSESSINVPMILIALLAGVYLIDFFVLKRWKLEIPQPVTLILFVFMAYAVFCFGFGQMRWYPLDPAPLRAQIGGLGIFLLSGFAYLLPLM